MATIIDLTTAGSSTTIDDAIFLDSANIGSGTGNYNTFLAVSPTPPQSGNEQGFNSDDTPPIDSSNQDIDQAKTHTVLLSTVPIIIVDGVEYYEFRVDLNEANSNPNGQISLDQFKIFSSTSGTIEDTTTLFGQNLVYDMDGSGDVSLQLSEVSTGSGTDDYAVLVPVSKFAGLDPATTYMYLYVDMGSLGGDYVAAGGFEEWNLQTAGTLTGTKFGDLDADGVKDAGEVGVGGVTIFIDNNFDDVVDATDNNGVLDPGERFTVTDADGNYTFYGVPLGTWQVDEVVPAGATQTTGDFETVTISSIGEIVTVDPIGNFIPFDISGTKYTDVNGDGIIDPEDTGLGGVTIFIDVNGDTLNNDGASNTTTTAADGSWSFTGLDASYVGKTVYEVLPSGYVQTLGAAGYDIVGTQTDLDFANFELFDISGTKYTDVNGDGIIDPEDTGLGGVTIFIDVNGDTLNNDGASNTTTTAADGTWSFTGLDASYDGLTVYEVLPDGYVQTLGAAGYDIVGTSGNDQTSLDFANFELFDISGTKYTDVNGDGTIDPEDTGLGGVTIFIDVNGDTINNDGASNTTTTAADGTWSFTGLDASYDGLTVYEVLPDGYVQTLGAAGYDIVGTSGNDQTSLDFANFELFDISGTKYTDVNGDGIIDPEDTGLGGVTIFIDVNGDTLNNDGASNTTTTAADGTWSFTDLDASYDGLTVYEVLPDGYVQTLGAAGYDIVGTSGNDQTDLDFANFELFDISGTKYTDVNGDGTIDPEDTGLGGVTIFIDVNGDTLNNDGASNTTTTAADGTWSFTDLDASYDGLTVYEVLPSGYVQTLGAAGYDIVGTSGNDQTGLDFANFELFDISGYKFADLNNNGAWDEDQGELGLQNWTIYLDDDTDPTNGVIATALTDADGKYQFLDLGPDSLDPDATYYIYEQQQNGWTETFDGSTSFTIESGVDLSGTFGEAEDLNFGNHLIEGPGVRTPGFWQSPFGSQFWDGVVGNEAKAGQDCFADGELTYQVDSNCDGVLDNTKGLLIGDYDGDGLTGAGEDTFFISLADAQKIIDASQKDLQDTRFVLARDAVATWLNFLAGNQIGDASDPTSPHFYLDAAIDWLQTTTGAAKDEDCSAWSTIGAKVKASSAAWNVGLDTQGSSALELAGNTIHSQLDEYNNTGSIDGDFFAFDADFCSDQQLQYLNLLQSAAI